MNNHKITVMWQDNVWKRIHAMNISLAKLCLKQGLCQKSIGEKIRVGNPTLHSMRVIAELLDEEPWRLLHPDYQASTTDAARDASVKSVAAQAMVEATAAWKNIQAGRK